MNKIFTFYAHTHCDGCGDTQSEPMSIYCVVTVEGRTLGQHLFQSFWQFCSEECRDKLVEELNGFNGGFLAFGYEVVKEKTS